MRASELEHLLCVAGMKRMSLGDALLFHEQQTRSHRHALPSGFHQSPDALLSSARLEFSACSRGRITVSTIGLFEDL